MYIDGVFDAVIAIVEEVKARLLKPVTDRRQILDNEATGLKDELEAEIQKFENTISELDDVSVLEDHILFLQVRAQSDNERNICFFSQWISY